MCGPRTPLYVVTFLGVDNVGRRGREEIRRRVGATHYVDISGETIKTGRRGWGVWDCSWSSWGSGRVLHEVGGPERHCFLAHPVVGYIAGNNRAEEADADLPGLSDGGGGADALQDAAVDAVCGDGQQQKNGVRELFSISAQTVRATGGYIFFSPVRSGESCGWTWRFLWSSSKPHAT